MSDRSLSTARLTFFDHPNQTLYNAYICVFHAFAHFRYCSGHFLAVISPEIACSFDTQPKFKKFDKHFSAESKLCLKVQRQEAQEMTKNVKEAIAFVDKKCDFLGHKITPDTCIDT